MSRIALKLLSSALLAAALVWTAGASVDSSQPLALLSSGVVLPVWAVWLLCIPCVATAATQLQQLRRAQHHYAVQCERGLRRDAISAGHTASEANDARGPSKPVGEDAAGEYHEDAVFGVVWRWHDEYASELVPQCPACRGKLVPQATGGSLSRGLHCERCNKLRAAGEHPSELLDKVRKRLVERATSGDWLDADARIKRARRRATRPIAELPAA